MPRTPSLLQTSTSDCGPAVLGMVLAAHGRLRSIADLRDELDVGRDGMSLRELKAEASARGLRARALFVEPPGRTREHLRQLRTPFIAHWDRHHYVVVSRVGRRGVRILDPAAGAVHLDDAELASRMSGAVLEVTPTPGPPARRERSAVRRLIAPLVREHRALLALGGVLSLIVTVLGLAVPAINASLVDDASRGVDPLRTALLAIGMLFVGMLAAGLARVQLTSWLQRRLGARLSVGTVERLMAARFSYIERRNPGDLVARVDAAHALKDIVASTLAAGVVGVTFVVVYGAALLMLAPIAALWSVVAVVVQVIIVLWVTRRTRELRAAELIAAAQGSDQLLSALRGFESLRAVAGEGAMLARWRRHFDAQLDASYRAQRLGGATTEVLQAIQVALPLVVLFAMVAGTGAPPGAAIAVSTLAGMMLGALPSVVALVVQLAEIGPLAERVDDVHRAALETEHETDTVGSISGSVTLESVTYRHDKRSSPVVEDVSVHVDAGQKLAVVGASGSGKSTLTRIITGLYRPSSGRVLIDGNDLATADLVALRAHIGVVAQNVFLSTGSIRDALLLGNPRIEAIEDEEMRDALRAAEILDEVSAMPMGWDTLISTGGTEISGGQRQRLALARALLRRPRILVLDEATSNLDPATEARIEANLSRLRMTRVVVSHRRSAVLDADRVIVISQGRVVQSGDGETVLAAREADNDVVGAGHDQSGDGRQVSVPARGVADV